MRRLVALTLALAGAAAQAQGYHPGYGYNGAPMSSFLSSSFLIQKVVNDTSFKRAGDGSTSTKSGASAAPESRGVTFEAGPRSTMPAKLAQAYPAPARTEVERVFATLLSKYPEVEKYFGVPRNDLAGSVAMFVAGSYEAYRNTRVADGQFKALVSQMRGVIGANADVVKAGNAEKQEMYEQMAIMGMFMSATYEALQKSPNPRVAEDTKQAAKGYLERFLKTDARRVQLTSQGLVLR